MGNHTLAVQRGLNMGVGLFIVSEALCNSPKPHAFDSFPLESSTNVFKFLKSFFSKQVINYISNYMVSILTVKITHLLNRYPLIYYYISKIDSKI